MLLRLRYPCRVRGMEKIKVDVYRKRRWFGWKWFNQATVDREFAARYMPDRSTRRFVWGVVQYRWEKP